MKGLMEAMPPPQNFWARTAPANWNNNLSPRSGFEVSEKMPCLTTDCGIYHGSRRLWFDTL